jgi:hypothetical protein
MRDMHGLTIGIGAVKVSQDRFYPEPGMSFFYFPVRRQQKRPAAARGIVNPQECLF